MNRQKLLLIILVALLALALAYAFWATPRQQRVTDADRRRPAASPRPESTSGGTAPAPGADTRVRLELLAREEEEFPGFERDIFRYRQPPPPPRPKVSAQPPSPPPVAPLPPIAAGGESPVTEAVQKELARFTFLGFLLKDGVKTIFLSSGDEIFTVRKGDRFGKEKNFLVTELTPERLTIRQADDPRPITIPLVEQSPLAAVPGMPPLRQAPRLGVPTIRRPSFPPQQNGAPPPFEPAEPIEPFEPVEIPPGVGVPMEEPQTDESNPPQDVAPSEVPNE